MKKTFKMGWFAIWSVAAVILGGVVMLYHQLAVLASSKDISRSPKSETHEIKICNSGTLHLNADRARGCIALQDNLSDADLDDSMEW